jgi:hypothetical protein
MKTALRRLLPCAALTLVLALLVAAPAGAYRLQGRAWPTHTITYFNAATPNAKALSSAVRAWNRSGAGIRFTAVSRSRAKLVIESTSTAALGGGDALGYATVGYDPPGARGHAPGGGVAYGNHVWLVPPSQSRATDSVLAQVAAHELGHVLGLEHETRGCATMNPTVDVLCPAPHPWQEHCRILEVDDIRGAIARYGGHVGSLGPQFCDLAPVPGAPTAVTASVADPTRGMITLDWTNPGGLTFDNHFLYSQLKGRATVEQYVVNATQGACIAPILSGALEIGNATAGAAASTTLSLPTHGHWCVTLAVSDVFDRFGTPAHVLVDVPG